MVSCAKQHLTRHTDNLFEDAYYMNARAQDRMEKQLDTDIAIACIPSSRTDISSLPLELHSEILGWLDHWIHLLPASQVCQSWRYLLKPRIQLSSLYQPVYTVLPHGKHSNGYYSLQTAIFGTPEPSLPAITHDHSRHALFQTCTIAYRRCPETGKPQLKIHPGKVTGPLSRKDLTYQPKLTTYEFYNCQYLSLLASPIVTDTRPLGQKTLIWLQISRLCTKTIYAMMRADGKYMQLGQVLDLILERYRECLELDCISCVTKLSSAKRRHDYDAEDEAESAEDDGDGSTEGPHRERRKRERFGQWDEDDYESFAKRCRQFGIVIREEEDMRLMGRIVLTISPGESW
ncbi:hypothetical protein ABW21_db0207460 [Orbilia brochopaga]|nr:hypothetical protein ABW21_db0207460 [Drechslerella brochopaga]